jgi:tetratricopeptide (TPR) repeat protein
METDLNLFPPLTDKEVSPPAMEVVENEAHNLKSYDLHMTKGVALLNAGRYKEAEAEFLMALSIRHDDPRARYHKGIAAGKLDKFAEAEADLSAVISKPNPIPAAYLDLGLLYYRQKEYQKSLAALERGIEVTPRHPLLYLYQGKVYQALGDHDTAVARFTKSLAYLDGEQPDIYIAALYHASVSYYLQKHDEDAKEGFLEVAEKAPETELGQSSQKFLAQIAKRENKDPRWELFLDGGLQYDTNVVLEPDDGAFAGAVSKKGDSRLIATLSGNYRFINASPWRISGGYLFYQSIHNTLRSFNGQVHQPSLTAAWGKEGKGRQLDYTMGYTTIDGEQYLQSHALRTTLFWVPEPTTQRSVFYQLQRKDFIDSVLFPINSKRDGTNQAIGVGVSRRQEHHLWQVGYTVDMENLRSADWEYLGHRVSGGIRKPFKTRFIAGTHLEYARRDYRYLNSFAMPAFSTKRKDDIYTANTEVSYRIMPWGDLSAEYSVTRNRSNIELFDYHRGIASLNFMRRF